MPYSKVKVGIKKKKTLKNIYIYIVSFKKCSIYLVAPKICSPRVSNSAACTELLKTKIDQLQNDIDTVSRPKTSKTASVLK